MTAIILKQHYVFEPHLKFVFSSLIQKMLSKKIIVLVTKLYFLLFFMSKRSILMQFNKCIYLFKF